MGASIGSTMPPQGGSPYGQGGSPYGQGGSPYGQGGSPYGQGGSPNGYRVGARTMPGYMPGRQGGMPQYGGGYRPPYGGGYQPPYGGFGGQQGNPFAGRNLTPQGISFMPRGGGYQQAPAPWRPPQYQPPRQYYPQQPPQAPQQPQYQPPQGGMSISDQIMSPVSPDITAPKPRTSTNPYVAPPEPAPYDPTTSPQYNMWVNANGQVKQYGNNFGMTGADGMRFDPMGDWSPMWIQER